MYENEPEEKSFKSEIMILMKNAFINLRIFSLFLFIGTFVIGKTKIAKKTQIFEFHEFFYLFLLRGIFIDFDLEVWFWFVLT